MKQDRRSGADPMLGTCVAALLALAHPTLAQEKPSPRNGDPGGGARTRPPRRARN